MWKDWLERTLTRNNAPVMVASELLCPEPANGNELGDAVALTPALSPRAHAEETPEPAEVQ